MIHKDQFEAEVAIYFRVNPSVAKYDSSDNRQAIVERMTAFGTIPSEVGVLRAIRELIDEGAITRADGGNDASDRQAAVNAERARINEISSTPSTPEEYERFARMSVTEIERLYWSDPVFQARYRKASERWKFRLPGKPSTKQADIPIESDPSEWRTLDEKTYRSLPSAKTIQLLRSDKGFVRAVNRLIAAGKI